MTRVKFGGKELTVADEQVAEYLAQGYSVIDSRGALLMKGNVLTFEEAIVENKRLKRENAALHEKIREMEKNLCHDDNAETDTCEAAEKPAKRARKTNAK